MELFRVNNTATGKPRYVVHYLDLLTKNEFREASHTQNWEDAKRRAKELGGKEYRGKDFGGGFVFATYTPEKLVNDIKLATSK